MSAISDENSGRFSGALRRSFTVPKAAPLTDRLGRLSPFDKLLVGLTFLFVLGSFLWVLNSLNAHLTERVPAPGGSITEGVIGSPRFINPLLAISDADRDLTQLVYAGLLHAKPDGELIPALAASYSISDDGLTYTFQIREDAQFHDGTPVTAEDVVFTVKQAQNAALKSPKRANWEGVGVEARGEREVAFILQQPYAPFLENATLGILPKHIWEQASAEQFPFSQFNTEPVGAGPFEVAAIRRNASGIPVAYELKPFADYVLGEPYLREVTLRFYPNEDTLITAYERGEIQALNSVTPERVGIIKQRGDTELVHVPLPRIFAVFFNQNTNTVFTRTEVRKALNRSIDRAAIIDEVLAGFGAPITGPLPTTLTPPAVAGAQALEDRESAVEILEENGWEREEESGVWVRESDDGDQRLAFTLTSSNVPELKNTALALKKQWEEFGAEVSVRFFDSNDLTQTVIRPREYEALFFGEIIGRERDFFAFWHSSQRNDPGLNVALYANITTDKLLEKARTTPRKKDQTPLFQEFATEVRNDIPAVFVYAPEFIYLKPKQVQGAQFGIITTASDRFLNAHEWFTKTDTIWTFLR